MESPAERGFFLSLDWLLIARAKTLPLAPSQSRVVRRREMNLGTLSSR